MNPRWWIRLVLSLAAGATFSFGKLAYHCRLPESEACVWGKAWLPLSVPLETSVFGLVLFVLWSLFAVRSSRETRRS